MPAAPGTALSLAEIRKDSDQRLRQLTEKSGAPDIFADYKADGPVTLGKNFTRRLDFTGIAWDERQTATLVSPQHVVMAAHFPRQLGATLTFHDRRGKPHQRTLKQVISLRGVADVCVGILDQAVPDSISSYRLLPPNRDYASLAGSLAIVTNQFRQAHLHEIGRIVGKSAFFKKPDPDRVALNLVRTVVKGDSGNPSFLLVGGELVLIETHTTGGMGAGPFYSDPELFNAINAAMKKLGGDQQLAVVPLR